MKNIFIFLVLLSSMAFAAQASSEDIQERCGSQCCSSFDGTWDGQSCIGAKEESVDSCISTCTSIASGKGGCCGPAFILLGIALGAGYLSNKKKKV